MRVSHDGTQRKRHCGSETRKRAAYGIRNLYDLLKEKPRRETGDRATDRKVWKRDIS